MTEISLYKKEAPVNVLIVDDEPMVRHLLTKAMGISGHHCHIANDGEAALDILANNPCDIVITDIDMPKMNGIELAGRILNSYSADVIMITGQIKDYQYDSMINLGASDFVAKPFAIKEIILRVNRVVKERRLKREAALAHKELEDAYIDSIHRLVMASEFKDEDTGDHIVRIGEYSQLMANKLELPEKEIKTIYYAAPMHDVGKIGIPDKILMKKGKLDNHEFDIIKGHTKIGAKLLSKSKSAILQVAAEIALSHHEKFNGYGYPNGIKGEDIPISGRIVAIVDTFDALTSKRPYKDPYPPEMAFDIIMREREAHFDPVITDLFLGHFDEFLEIREKIGKLEAVRLEDFMLSERDKIKFNT